MTEPVDCCVRGCHQPAYLHIAGRWYCKDHLLRVRRGEPVEVNE